MGFASFGLVSSVRHAAVAALGLSAVFASGGAWAGQVHALHGDGASYIDTGVTPGSTTRVVIRLAFDADFSGQNGLGGSGSKQTLRFGQANDSTSVRRLFACVNDSYNTCVYSTKAVDTDWHNLDLSAQGDLLFDGEKLGTGGLTKSCTGPMYLFAMNQQWSPANTACSYIKGSISTCKIYTGEKLVRDLVAWEKPDGTLCFKNLAYASSDAATGTEYYEKKGTGSFTAVCPDDVLVVSASDDIHGAATPDYGVYTGLTAGDARSLSSDASSVSLDGLIRGTCTGWKLYNAAGEVVNEGSGTSVNYTHPNPAAYRKLVWQRSVEYKVTATAGANGTVASTTAWASEGESATITATATPNDGYAFFRWTGDIGSADPAEPKITAQVPVGGSLVALFGRQLVVDAAGSGEGVYADLDAAVAAAADYDTILVKPGTYMRTADSMLTVAKPIKIVSEGGRAVTHVRGRYGNVGDDTYKTKSRGLTLNHELAILKGISLWNYGNDGAQSDYTTGLDIQAGLAEYCAVSNCRPNWGGCAVTLSSVKSELRHSLVQRCKNNDSSNAGIGVVRLTAGLVTNCVIRGNSRTYTGYGGGVSVNGADAKLTGCDIFGNSSASGGGGVYLANGLVENCAISNNSNSAAGVYQTGGTMRNCLVMKNTAGYTVKYAGVQATGGTIENCEISGNTAYYPEGMQLQMTGGTIRNTTVAQKLDAIPSKDFVNVAAGVTVENCTFQCPSVKGSKELNATAYFTSNDVCWIEADKVVGQTPLKVSFKAHCPGATSFAWDFGDGKSTSTDANPTFTFQNPSNYVVKLTCGTLDPVTLAVKALTNVAYVATDGGNVFPYDTQAKAAKNLQDALDAVYADDTVRGTVNVAAGTWEYNGSEAGKNFVPWHLVNRAVRVLGPEEGEALFNAKRKIMTIFLFHPRAALERLTLSNGRLNQTKQYGGSLHMMNGLVTNCVVSKGNSDWGGNATIRGGSIWNSIFKEGDLTVSGTDRPSGGLQVRGAVTVANCSFLNNRGGYGAGVSMHTTGCVVSNCVISGNYGASQGGGGVALDAGLLTHCVISNNTASFGGGLHLSGGTARNCLIVRNTSSGSAGGVYAKSGTMENCTVAYNTSGSTSDELYRKGGTVRNCVFCGKGTAAANDVDGTGCTLTYSCFREGVTQTGTGVVCKDPKLNAPASGDFKPAYGSPAVDGGTTITAVTSDLLGNPRPINDVYDMGCYEMDFSGQMNADFSVSPALAGGPTNVTLVASVDGGTEPYTYTWTIDGKVTVTDQETNIVWMSYGAHNISLVVTDKDGNSSDPVSRPGSVKVMSAVVYMSNTGSNTWPYDTWEKATSDTVEALGAVYSSGTKNGTIYVADGTYAWPAGAVNFLLDVTVPVDVIGTNAACGAKFDGANAYRVLCLNNVRASVRNVWFYRACGGYAPNSASHIYAGTVSNCVFTGKTTIGGGALYMTGGLCVDSTIRDYDAGGNVGQDRRGGGIELTGGTVERCVVHNCSDGTIGGVYLRGANAVVRDSVIRNCYSDSGAVVQIDSGLLERCVITNNTCGAGTARQANFVSGAGLYVKGGTARNCLVVNNRQTSSSDAKCGGCAVDGGTAYNNTVWANTMKDKSTNDVYVAKGKLANTIAGTATVVTGTAEGNYVGFAPGFKRPAKGDFRLKGSSPAVGIGVKSYWDGVTDPTDLVGNPRFSAHGLNAGCYQNPIRGMTLLVR